MPMPKTAMKERMINMGMELIVYIAKKNVITDADLQSDDAGRIIDDKAICFTSGCSSWALTRLYEGQDIRRMSKADLICLHQDAVLAQNEYSRKKDIYYRRMMSAKEDEFHDIESAYWEILQDYNDIKHIIGTIDDLIGATDYDNDIFFVRSY